MSGDNASCKSKEACGGKCDEHDDGVREYYGSHIDHPPIGSHFDYGSIGKSNARAKMNDEDLISNSIDEGY